MTADLLVLDDLGAEKTSEWVDETMNLIVNTRYSERRVTLFTSNYQDIPDDTDPNSLVFRIGARMRSRLHEMCEFIILDAADYLAVAPTVVAVARDIDLAAYDARLPAEPADPARLDELAERYNLDSPVKRLRAALAG